MRRRAMSFDGIQSRHDGNQVLQNSNVVSKQLYRRIYIVSASKPIYYGYKTTCALSRHAKGNSADRLHFGVWLRGGRYIQHSGEGVVPDIQRRDAI